MHSDDLRSLGLQMEKAFDGSLVESDDAGGCGVTVRFGVNGSAILRNQVFR